MPLGGGGDSGGLAYLHLEIPVQIRVGGLHCLPGPLPNFGFAPSWPSSTVSFTRTRPGRFTPSPTLCCP